MMTLFEKKLKKIAQQKYCHQNHKNTNIPNYKFLNCSNYYE